MARIEFRDLPRPSAGAGQLLIQVKGNAVCASEIGSFRDGTERVPGHEAAGVVAEAGLGTDASVGTPGVVFAMDFCGECRNCRLGCTNQCLGQARRLRLLSRWRLCSLYGRQRERLLPY